VVGEYKKKGVFRMKRYVVKGVKKRGHPTFIKTISGKAYQRLSINHTKRAADKEAKELRSNGYLARVIPTYDSGVPVYVVYMRSRHER